MPAAPTRASLDGRDLPDQRDIRLYDATDIPWIATVVDHVVEARNQPWRTLRESLEHSPIRAPRVAAILGALRRTLGGKAERGRVARKVRGLVLGHPALDDHERAARLTAASNLLGLEPAEVDNLMWIDLASERPVTLPDGRPDERRLAAYANLDRIQRAVRRARELRLVVWGEAHELIRTAKRYGLLVTVSRGRDPDATVLDIVGPLSLFHATGVYGGALAALVPLLADIARFELSVTCDFGYGPSILTLAPPVLLPPASRRGTPSIAARLARELTKISPTRTIERDPPPLIAGAELVFPDFLIDDAIAIELIGFATADYLAAQLSRYQLAGVRVLLCVHDKRSPAERANDKPANDKPATDEPAEPRAPPQILRFSGRLTAAAVLTRLAEIAELAELAARAKLAETA